MASESPHQLLLHALETRLEVVNDRDFYARNPDGHLQALQRASEELDSVYDREKEAFDPQLRHFIERQSYLKAIEHLQAALKP